MAIAKEGGSKKKPSARSQMARERDFARNAKKPAPLGRYEDKSPVPASRASKSAIKKAAAEGPKRSVAKKSTKKK